jgi:predicted enzyme related to lactoylglutathione lyase
MTHTFSYCELHSDDPARAKKFYGELFGWSMSDTPIPTGTYTELKPPGGLEAGLMQNSLGGAQAWIVYVAVDDVRAATERARALGAEVLADPNEVPNVGWFSIVRDPAGAAFGMFQRRQ